MAAAIIAAVAALLPAFACANRLVKFPSVQIAFSLIRKRGIGSIG